MKEEKMIIVSEGQERAQGLVRLIKEYPKVLLIMEREIVSLNMAGWAWKITDEGWKQRMERTCEYIRKRVSDPMIIGLQEVQLSGGKSLETLEKWFPEYHIVLPAGYNNQPKSAISIMLIRRNICESYSIDTLDDLENNLLYNYVTINTTDELCLRVLNVHIPHTCCEDNRSERFQQDRKELRAKLVGAVSKLAESDINFIALGDFNTPPDDSFIENLDTFIDSPMLDPVLPKDKKKATWINGTSKNRLDYILYSSGLICDTGVSAQITQIDDTTITDKMSDHAFLIGGIAY